MKKIILTLILFAAVCTQMSAQTVESIRKDYNETQAHIKMMNDPEYPPTNRYQLTIEQMLGGSGEHKETVAGDYEYRFYCGLKGVLNVISKRKGFGETKFSQEYSGAMNEDYTGIFNTYKTKADKYKKLFSAIENCTNK
ncbi:MAG: hypothetical protein II956_03210 [Bacteroidales bacterium]|nr:hypothetical protein [Bacteroidales bacterium]